MKPYLKELQCSITMFITLHTHQKVFLLIMTLQARYNQAFKLFTCENECEGGVNYCRWMEVTEDLRYDRPDFFKTLQDFDVPFREFDEENETFAEAIIKCSIWVHGFNIQSIMQMIDPTKHGVKIFYMAYHELTTRIHNPKYRSTFD